MTHGRRRRVRGIADTLSQIFDDAGSIGATRSPPRWNWPASGCSPLGSHDGRSI